MWRKRERGRGEKKLRNGKEKHWTLPAKWSIWSKCLNLSRNINSAFLLQVSQTEKLGKVRRNGCVCCKWILIFVLDKIKCVLSPRVKTLFVLLIITSPVPIME